MFLVLACETAGALKPIASITRGGSDAFARIRGSGCVAQPLLMPVAPVAYQVNLEPGIGQLREFEPRRVHTHIDSLGLFLVHRLTCGKRESVS